MPVIVQKGGITPGPLYIPALRCKMGDWTYYATCLRFQDVAERIVAAESIHDTTRHSDLLQRKLRPERIEEISTYLQKQKEHFFNSLVVSVYRGSVEWLDLELENPEVNPVDTIPSYMISDINMAFGVLYLSGKEELYAVDGQHRVAGIQHALEEEPTLGIDHISVLFVRDDKDEGRQRTRRLFATLNRYARPVSEGERIALDEDDAYAIVTRRLIDEHPLLKEKRTAELQIGSLGKTDFSFTTTLNIYKTAQILCDRRKSGWTKDALTYIRPASGVIEEIYNTCKEFWDGLAIIDSEVAKLENTGSETIVQTARRNGGNLLFRPVGQLAFARATRLITNSKNETGCSATLDAMKMLREAPVKGAYEVNSPLWSGLLWNPAGDGSMLVAQNRQQLAARILCYYTCRCYLPPKRNLTAAGQYQKLTAEYQKLTANLSATLPPLQ